MFKIGEFARIANVSTYLLRHYDDIQLFSPSYIDAQSGYRYYTVEQLSLLHRILALREIGLSLEQIAKMLRQNVQHCDIRGMLLLKQHEIEAQIEQERSRLRRIESHLRQLDSDTETLDYSVVIKPAPAINYLSTGHELMSDTIAAQILGETYDLLAIKQDIQLGFSLVLVHDEMTPEGLHNIEIGYPVKQSYPDGLRLSTGRVLHVRQLPAIEMLATVIHHGTRAENPRVYQALFQWMDANQYEHYEGQPSREIYLKPGNHDTDPENIVEIQIPVRQKS